MKLGNLTIRKWLIVAWLAYALLPGVALAISYGLAYLVVRHDPRTDSVLSPTIVAIAACVQFSIPVIVAIFLGRAVLRPLAAVTQASRQIVAGNLDFELPPSQVREVAEVSAAFNAMGAGLRQALERQAELEQERRYFIGAIAHDLRTPLFSLRGHLQGLERGVADTPEKAARYVAVCQEKADELERLVEDLFTYTRMEYQERPPQCAPLELGDVFRRATDGVRPRAEAKAITVALDGPAAPIRLEGDELLLTRAVTNLLDNALRHTPTGGTVCITWREDGDRIVFMVADSGPGFDPHDLPHLFEPLYRGEASRSRKTGGAGLGLTIARRILQAHGGDLTAANLSHGGAELTGTLARRVPFMAGDEPEADARKDEKGWSREQAPASAP
jgi:signal transduction histidine kinase